MKGIVTLTLFVSLVAWAVAEKDLQKTPTSSAPLDCDRSHNSTCVSMTSSALHHATSMADAGTRSDLHEARLRQPHQVPNQIVSTQASATAPPAVVDTNEETSNDTTGEESSESEPGLTKVHYAVMSVCGVLVVAGITAGIFVWRAVHRRSSLAGHQDGRNSQEGESHEDEKTVSNKSDLFASSLFSESELRNRLDFDHSLEKIFDVHHGIPSPVPVPRRIQVSLAEAQDHTHATPYSASFANLAALHELPELDAVHDDFRLTQ